MTNFEDVEFVLQKINSKPYQDLEELPVVERIRQKRAILESAKNNLKKKFIGLDSIIDEMISNIEVWFTIPELLTSPTIVCLWGLTGTGKCITGDSLVFMGDGTEKLGQEA